MAKPHKYAWTGVDIETSLSMEQVANMAHRAAQESTGDLLKGKQRIVSTRSTDRQIEFRINDYLISFNKLMVFVLDFEPRSGVTFASTRIEWYKTSQQTVGGFIPVSTKRMVAHHTYLQFAHHLADQARAADPAARVKLREGVETAASSVEGPFRQRPEGSEFPPPPPPPPAAGDLVPPRPPQPPSSMTPVTAPATPPAPTASPMRAAPQPTIFTGRPSPAAVPVHAVSAPIVGAASGGLVTAVPDFARSVEPPVPEMAPVASARPVASRRLDVLDDEDDLDATRRSSGKLDLRWELRLPDGTSFEVRDAAVVGRNPVPPATISAAARLPLTDHTQSVSKTHAALEVRDGLIWITDLHSTNGTVLTNPSGERSVSPAGQAMPAGHGWQVAFGDFIVQLRSR